MVAWTTTAADRRQTAGTADGGRTTNDGGETPTGDERRQSADGGDSQFVAHPTCHRGTIPNSLRPSVAQDYAELGLAADDETLRTVAEAIVELGLNETGE